MVQTVDLGEKFIDCLKLCPKKRFKIISQLLPSIKTSKLHYIVYLTQKFTFDKVDLLSNEIDINIGKIYYINSYGMKVGYLFKLPNFQLKVANNFVSLTKHSYVDNDLFTKVKVIFMNNDISVLSAHDHAICITVSKSTKF